MNVLSVVVTIVDGGAALERCLRALTEQQGAPDLEVLVPYDSTRGDVAALAGGFPNASFVDLGDLPTEGPPETAAAEHERIDRRRAAGLTRASGDFIALVEDRVVPRPDWAQRLVAEHAAPHAVVGGSVANGSAGRLLDAVYRCDYGRYRPPFVAGPAEFLTDVNVSYARAALDMTREQWCDRYHETTVHWALQRAGEELWLSPAPAVDFVRDRVGLAALLRERFAFARVFAYTRVAEAGLGRRIGLAALTPLLPALLLLRHVRAHLAWGEPARALLPVLPALLLVLVAWSAGELLGYATGEA